MKNMRLCRKIGILVLLAVAFSCPVAYAGTAGTSSPQTGPPNGLAIQQDAQGTKLYGVMTIEFYATNIQYEFDARIFARLRKGSDLKTFFGEAPSVDTRNLMNADTRILGAADPYTYETIKHQILREFFRDDQSLNVVLKNLTEYAEKDIFSTLPVSNPSSISVADIEIAVK